MLEQRRDGRGRASLIVGMVAACCLLVASCSSDSKKSDHATHPSGSTASEEAAGKVRPLPPARAGQPMVKPKRITAKDGSLATTITVRRDSFNVGGTRVGGKSYAGAFIGPTLELSPGDTLRIKLDNRLSHATNLHFHGLHVSPEQPSDDVLIHVGAKRTFDYVVKIPDDHPAGTFWYHSHEHQLSEQQVFGGLSGLIVIDGERSELPASLQRVPEVEFVLKDTQVMGKAIVSSNINSDAPTTRTVNGQVKPVHTLAPGETQLWRLANIGADIFYELHLDGQKFHVIAEDGNPTWNVWQADRLVLPPGKRFDVLVVGPPAGTHPLTTAAYDQGGDHYPEVQLATIRSKGVPRTAAALPTSIAPKSDLATAKIDRKRHLVFSEDDASSKFMIDGKQFSPTRVDQHVELGAVEEWTIENDTTEQHPFHIHVNDFEVMSVGGKPYDAHSLQDTVNLPSKKEVVIRLRFADFVGKFVYHCHILNHEDHGMMGIVEVSK